MPVEKILNARVPVKVWTDRIEPEAIEQLKNTASLPFVFKHVAAMPDVHLGIGATVGSVVATKGAVCPAAVGVDIGCGMMARKTSIPADRLDGEGLKKLRHSIEREIPVGFEQKREPFDAALEWMHGREKPHAASDALVAKAVHQLGTLGGGNHFIEVCRDQDDGLLWLLLHSGSRNIGKSVAEIHIGKAKSAVKKMAESLPDPDLAYFVAGTPEFREYREDVEWCQGYARQNREIMMDRILRQVAYALGFEGDVSRLGITTSVNCHHNYIADEVHFGQKVLVTRKGAIRAGRGELGIIPGSMGTGSYIVRGLGNREAFESAPHGAGRRMSRGEAKRRFTKEDLECQTEGVECRKDRGVLDEIPGAYKPIGEVIEKSSDLVEVVAGLKQIVCVKG
ncbi:MAG TPA: RtcB family protein [Thermoanaerobaculia bacterium]|nr:RtcB family protein [Thermoanaerobaculia bacterium]